MTNAPDSDQWALNESLLRGRVEQELHAGRDFVESRVTSAIPGFLGRVVNPLTRSLWDHVGEAQVRKRVLAHVDVVLSACRDSARSGDVSRAVEAHLPRALETEELVHRARRGHAAFPELEAVTRQAFAERVDAVHVFLAEGTGEDYAAVARSAFPDREALAARIRAHIAHGRDALDVVTAHPDLIAFPRALQKPMLRLMRDVTDWYESRVLAALDALYARA